MDLNQVTIGSTDVARSTRFYQQLGLRLVVDSAPRYVRFECPNGAAIFSIHHVDTVAAPATTLIYFDCADLDQRYRELCAAGVIFDSAPEDQRWLWREARRRMRTAIAESLPEIVLEPVADFLLVARQSPA